MSVFVEILKCLLCCEEDRFDDSEDEYDRFLRIPLLGSNDNTLIRRIFRSGFNNPPNSSHSSSTISTRNQSQPRLTPSNLPVQYRVVLGTGTDNSCSDGSNYVKSEERIYDVLRIPNNYSLFRTSSSYDSSTKTPQSSSTSQPISISIPKPPTSSTKPPLVKIPITTSKLSDSSTGPLKPTLSPAPSMLTNQETKASYVQKDTSPLYMIPDNIKELIKKDITPDILRKPVSPSTYEDYFAALLHAEDYYIEKWSDFKLRNVTLKLSEASIYKRTNKNPFSDDKHKKDDKTFVEFEIASVREKRPFLLSRDFVFAKPSGTKLEPFQGIIYRVVKSTIVLVEFGEDFHSQHFSTSKYDVSFSFNRVCLKRAHQAVTAASNALFRSLIFPNYLSRKNTSTTPPLHFHDQNLNPEQKSTARRLLSFQGPPPYLIEGPLCVTTTKNSSKQLSRTGLVIRETVLQRCQSLKRCRILICAPINNTCDVLMRSLKPEIPESDMFRANAAFREVDGVPTDILDSCLFEGECFACPSLKELKKYKVILSTFISSFRLINEGISAGHFSHMFLVDASSATEPETMVALANLADENTTVVVTGTPGNQSGWVRSDIARQNGLRVSYFERLRKGEPYKGFDPTFITQLVDTKKESSVSFGVGSSAAFF